LEMMNLLGCPRVPGGVTSTIEPVGSEGNLKAARVPLPLATYRAGGVIGNTMCDGCFPSI